MIIIQLNGMKYSFNVWKPPGKERRGFPDFPFIWQGNPGENMIIELIHYNNLPPLLVNALSMLAIFRIFIQVVHLSRLVGFKNGCTERKRLTLESCTLFI